MPGLELAGVGPVGVPVHWSGHNERVAWAATHARAVTTDLYVETLDSKRADRVMGAAGLEPLAVREERIAVRGGDDVVLRVRVTKHGPLLDELLGAARPAFAVAWGGAAPGDGVAALLRAARDAASFRTALAGHHDPVLAFVYADAAGQGGRQVAGWLPERNMPTGLVPVPGRSPWYDWRGRLPYDTEPRRVLGDTGFVIASDEPLDDAGAIEWWWRSGERAARIGELLAAARARGPIDAPAIATVLADQVSAGAPARVAALLSLAAPLEDLAPEARDVAAMLSAWDGRSDAASPGAAAWHVLLDAVLSASLVPVVGEDLLDRYLDLRGVRTEALLDALLEGALGEREEAIVGADPLRAAVRDGLRRTGLTLRVRLGPDRARWRWGELHPLRFAPFGWSEAAWGAGAPRSWPFGGDGVTINAGEYDPAEPFAVRVASVHRWIVDLAAPEVALSVLVPGVSEHAGDPLRDEGVARWLAGRPGVLATHRFLVEDGARARLTLVPSPAPEPSR
jgi:penicillin amidase